MNSRKNQIEINVDNNQIGILRVGDADYISLTDLARYANSEDPSGVIRNWMSNKNSYAFYALWEELNNPNFNSVESHGFKINEVPYNRFTMTPSRWRKQFNAVGFISGSGKYSKGTYAHPDIAFEFASWLSPEFKMYLIKEFERLKEQEAQQSKIDWRIGRMITKANYLLHTTTIKDYIVPNASAKKQVSLFKANKDIKKLYQAQKSPEKPVDTTEKII